MGCGHSKINLYPRRGKRKGSSKKSAEATDKEESEEEEGSMETVTPEEVESEESDTAQDVLPIADHQPTFEVSISQKNFFKMLDEKIAQGKDYDSTSETEILLEEERLRKIIEHWHAHTQANQSLCQSGPLMPSKRHLTRSVSKISERQCAPSTSKQIYWHESTPTRRSQSAQTNEPRPSTSDREATKSPVKRTQSAGSTWRSSPKVVHMPKASSDKKEEPVPGCSKDSQITYNPTFQTDSPAHSKSQPIIAQISSCQLSQQVAMPSPSKYVAPPEEYQDPELTTIETPFENPVTTQSENHCIYGNTTTTSPDPEVVQQRQQTAINLQHYVAMKQAQQQFLQSFLDSRQGLLPDPEPSVSRMHEGEELAAQYGYPGLRPQSTPNRAGHSVSDVTHTHSTTWSPLPPVTSMAWTGGQVPMEMQYYPQSQFMSLLRVNSAGSAGTLPRYTKGDGKNVINVVRDKPVGQIVPMGAEGLAVSSTVSDSPSPASLSTDSGVSPGTSAQSSKSSISTTPPSTSANVTLVPKPKKKKSPKRLKASKSLGG